MGWDGEGFVRGLQRERPPPFPNPPRQEGRLSQEENPTGQAPWSGSGDFLWSQLSPWWPVAGTAWWGTWNIAGGVAQRQGGAPSLTGRPPRPPALGVASQAGVGGARWRGRGAFPTHHPHPGSSRCHSGKGTWRGYWRRGSARSDMPAASWHLPGDKRRDRCQAGQGSSCPR